MYRWRKLTDEQRALVLQDRKVGNKPWHSPPHYESSETSYYMITAACFNHVPVIGLSPDRMSAFEAQLLACLYRTCRNVFAWIVLPNHYHALIDTLNVASVLSELGRLHGRTSFIWNGEEDRRGRQVWCNAAETAMKSESHFFASINYVLNNAVRHEYVARWLEWPYCNANEYLETIGRERAREIWLRYPLYDYGKDWDPPEL